VRYCGIDVSARAANQQLVTLAEQGAGGLVATFHPPRTPEGLGRTIAGFDEVVVAVDAPSGPRLDLLRPGSALRIALGLPDGRYERMRVCDALLFRRGLPLYPVPSAEQPRSAWQDWMQVGFELFAALGEQQLYHPPEAAYEGRVGEGALAHGRLCETYPDAIFCTLPGHRPSAKRTPSGLQERIAVLKLKGVVDADGGLWRRTLDELDACAAAYAAYGLAAGVGSWVGHPDEGVVVLPSLDLRDRYDKLPAPARQALA